MKSYKKYKTYPEYQGIVTLDEMKAHNNFLHMAGEIGLAGFLAFCWFPLDAVWGYRQDLRPDKR